MSPIVRSTISFTARTLSPDTAMKVIVPMYGHSSSVFARNSVMSILSSSTSTITPDLATAGSPASSDEEAPRGRAPLYRSLAVKTVLLAVIFLIVPLILYWQFKAADEEKQDLLLRSVREQGRVLGQALLPLLSTSERQSLPQLGRELSRFADDVTNVKLLLAPPGGGFFYIASSPVVPPAHLDIEREKLQQ